MGQGMWENKLTGLRDHVHALGSAQEPSGRTRVKRRSWVISHRGIVPTQAMRAGPEWDKGTKSVLCDLVGPSFSNNNLWEPPGREKFLQGVTCEPYAISTINIIDRGA